MARDILGIDFTANPGAKKTLSLLAHYHNRNMSQEMRAALDFWFRFNAEDITKAKAIQAEQQAQPELPPVA